MSETRHIELTRAAMTVTPTFGRTGSILADTASNSLEALETSLEIESPADPAAVAAAVATAERMCYVLDAIQRPHEVQRSVTLNGAPL